MERQRGHLYIGIEGEFWIKSYAFRSLHKTEFENLMLKWSYLGSKYRQWSWGVKKRLSLIGGKAGGQMSERDCEGAVNEIRRELRERSVLKANWGKFSRSEKRSTLSNVA